MTDKRSTPDLAQAFTRHWRDVFRYLLRRTRDFHEAEELTQRVFADAASALARDQRPESLLAWLYTVAQRRFVDEARRRARAADVTAETARTLPVEAPAYGAPVAQALKRGLEALPEDQRAVVAMKILEGRSFAAIAAKVGSTEGACKMRFSRGIKQLREFLRDEGIGP